MSVYPQGSAQNLETKSYLSEVIEGTSRVSVTLCQAIVWMIWFLMHVQL